MILLNIGEKMQFELSYQLLINLKYHEFNNIIWFSFHQCMVRNVNLHFPNQVKKYEPDPLDGFEPTTLQFIKW